MIGYLFFSLTILCYAGLAIINGSKPVGNQQMGYAYALFFLEAAFACSSLLLTITILIKGGFEWIAQGTGSRISLALLTWLLITVTTFGCAYFKGEWQGMDLYPQFIRWMAGYNGQVWIPLPWLVLCIVSLNPSWRSALPIQLITNLFWVGLGFSLLFSGGLLAGYLRDSVEAKKARQIEDDQQWHQNVLAIVTAHKPEDSISDLLRFTTSDQADDVRQLALTKVKAYPDWEGQLLELLQHESDYTDVYYFLGSNAVEHPEAFAQPLNQSIVWLLEPISKSIKTNNQERQFEFFAIPHLVQSLDGPFSNQGVDFYPNMARLQRALDTPPLARRSEIVRYTDVSLVNQWLAKHKK